MRLLDYKSYEVELHDSWVGSTRGSATSPRATEWSACISGCRADAGSREGPARLAHVFIYPNTAIDLYPIRSDLAVDPDGHLRTRRPEPDAAAGARRPADPRRPVRQPQGEALVERRGRRSGREPAGRSRTRLRAGALSRREAASVGSPTGSAPTWPSRVTRPRRRSRVERAPASGYSPRRWSGSRATASTTSHRPHRDGRRRLDLAGDYHFETREALLEEALEYSYELAGDVRIGEGEGGARSHARLAAMVDQCLPYPGMLSATSSSGSSCWLRASRHPELARPRRGCTGGCAVVHRGDRRRRRSGEFRSTDPDRLADRLLALLDGFGIRVLVGDLPIEARGGGTGRPRAGSGT